MADYLVAHDHRTGVFYAKQFGMDPRNVLTDPKQIIGLSPHNSFLFVNSDNADPDPEVLERLLTLESRGAAVDWFGITREDAVDAVFWSDVQIGIERELEGWQSVLNHIKRARDPS